MLRCFALFFALGLFSQGALPPGKPLNFVSMHDPKGGDDIDLQKYRGKLLLITLVSTTCQHCGYAVDALTRIQREYAARGVQFIGICGDNDGTLCQFFVDDHHPNFPFGYFGHALFAKLADIKPDSSAYVPVMIFVDAKGMMRSEIFGDDERLKAPKLEGTVRSILNEMLGESRPAVPSKK